MEQVRWGLYIALTILWNIGSGYNEFSKVDNIVRIVRQGFPGKNHTIFYPMNLKILKLKILIKQGLNPRCNILLVLKIDVKFLYFQLSFY
jgi:hypothetical protein